MTGTTSLAALNLALKWLPLIFLAVLVAVFGSIAPRFLDPANLMAILAQASWLIILALGVNFVLLTAGVDLSIGAIMYFVIACVGLLLPELPLVLWPLAAISVGTLIGLGNGVLIVRLGLPAFIATLALAFMARGAGLWMSDTQMVFAPEHLAAFGRGSFMGLGQPLILAAGVFALSWLLLSRTAFGIGLRAIGADAEGARRAGVPRTRTLCAAYALSGAFAGLAGFVSFSQTSAATAAFGLNAEFLAIAAAVLGGTSLFGGRGSAIAPVAGAILITTVQNGLVMIDANPYAYPVLTGAVIFLAALLDGARLRITTRLARRRILAPVAECVRHGS